MRRLLGAIDVAEPEARLLDAVVLRALEEDQAFADASTVALPGAAARRRGDVIAREGGVLAGTAAFRRAFEIVSGERGIAVDGARDGHRFAAGETVLTVRASGRVLLAGERTALNFLQRLSGIATATRRCVDATGGRLAVCDTRKTTPGLRALEKHAVVVGGGHSHRASLADMVMLKENHLAIAGGIGAAVAAVRADARAAALPLTVEVRTLAEAIEAAALKPDRLLLDNMSPAEMRQVVEALGPRESRPELEASGGITLESLPQVAATGVDLVSLGALTHSARAIDFSLLVTADS
jgi:nicotinate-nucleotide pyrophosphorylase (carboxylating)